MAWTNKPHTIAIAYAHICAGEDPWVALGNFTNDFFQRKNRVRLLQVPLRELPMVPMTPPLGSETTLTHESDDLHRWAIFCVATVEYLCSTYHLEVPSWVSQPQFAPLAEPWYLLPKATAENPQVRAALEEQTPEAFKAKNIYCGNRVFLDKRAEAEKFRQMLSA